GAGAGVAHPLVRSGFPRDLARPRAAAVVRADRRAGRGVGGEHEDRRAAGRAAEGLFIYTAGATGFRGVLGRYLGAVGGSAAHAGAAAADPQGGSAPGGLPGECGAPEALTWRRPDLHEPRPNIDLRRERPMDRTLVGDLERLESLLLGEVPIKGDLALDPIEHALPGLTLGAVFRVNPRVAQPHRHARERPLCPSRIQRDGHGGSGAQRRQEQIIGSGTAIGATGGHGLVGDQSVAPEGDLLDESQRAAAHDHEALLRWIDHDVTSLSQDGDLPPPASWSSPPVPLSAYAERGDGKRASMSKDSGEADKVVRTTQRYA